MFVFWLLNNVLFKGKSGDRIKGTGDSLQTIHYQLVMKIFVSN
jgi:hypothetical protein